MLIDKVSDLQNHVNLENIKLTKIQKTENSNLNLEQNFKENLLNREINYNSNNKNIEKNGIKNINEDIKTNDKINTSKLENNLNIQNKYEIPISNTNWSFNKDSGDFVVKKFINKELVSQFPTEDMIKAKINLKEINS